MPSVLAVFAHPDDIEFVAAGTLALLDKEGWEIHYFNLCNGNCGSVLTGPKETAAIRLDEAKQAAHILNAHFHPPISNDLELIYSTELLKKTLAVVRSCKPEIILTHSPKDYMEDHTNASRLAVTAAFSMGIPNLQSDPLVKAVEGDITVYHATPHGQRDQLRKEIRSGLYVNIETVMQIKTRSLGAHQSQKHWLDKTQGMDSYLITMEKATLAVGLQSAKFKFAEGWRRHLHWGFSSSEHDPLADALKEYAVVDKEFEKALNDHDQNSA